MVVACCDAMYKKTFKKGIKTLNSLFVQYVREPGQRVVDSSH